MRQWDGRGGSGVCGWQRALWRAWQSTAPSPSPARRPSAGPSPRWPDRMRLPARTRCGRWRSWSTTGGGCWSCRPPAGASRRSTGPRPPRCVRTAAGPTLVVSPLLALMRDQIAAAERAGLRAATVNSTNVDDWAPVLADLRDGPIDVLLISPERLANPAFAAPAAGSARLLRAAGHRRGALRLGLGLRLPARLPAADPHAAVPRAGHAGAGHHGDRQRAGDRRRRRPARRRHGDAARFAGPGVAAAGGGARR